MSLVFINALHIAIYISLTMETVTGVTVKGYKAGVHIRTFDVPFSGAYDTKLIYDVSDIDKMSVEFFIRVNPSPVFSPTSPLNLSMDYDGPSSDEEEPELDIY